MRQSQLKACGAFCIAMKWAVGPVIGGAFPYNFHMEVSTSLDVSKRCINHCRLQYCVAYEYPLTFILEEPGGKIRFSSSRFEIKIIPQPVFG